MRLPYNRPHLMEFHDQPWCPNFIRAHCQAILTFIWTHRIPPFQLAAPYEGASMVLEGLVREVEDEDGEYGRAKKKGKLRVVDCCSGAGGPLPMIERRVKWVDQVFNREDKEKGDADLARPVNSENKMVDQHFRSSYPTFTPISLHGHTTPVDHLHLLYLSYPILSTRPVSHPRSTRIGMYGRFI